MVLASVIAGASGGALANVALSPLGGGAGMLQSYWYGAGLILGERDMYTFHWEKIKKRLESGEDYLSVLEGEMTPAITAIANFSLEIMEKTSQIYLTAGVDMLAKLVENMLMLLAGEKPNEMQCPDGFKWDSIMNQCRPTTVEDEPEPDPTPTIDCPTGFRWSASAQQCVPEDISEPEPIPIPDEEPLSTFIPPIYNSSINIELQAIAQIVHVGDGGQINIQQTKGKWTFFQKYPTFAQALGTAGLFYPAPKWKLIMFGVPEKGYFVRLA